jgi:hypothetical protein
MYMRRIVSVVLVGSLTVFALPSATRADEVPAAETASAASDAFAQVEEATPTLRGSIDGAVSKAVKTPRHRRFAAGLRAQTRFQSANGGGGGGGGTMIMMLIGTVASLGATYFIMKSMREQTEQTPTALTR